MFRHSLVPLGVALVLALAGCGGSEGSESGNAEDTVSAAAPAEDQAAVLVTRDCGKRVVLAKTEVEAGQTAMQALDRVADIETASGGKFVSEIEDVAQNNAKKLAWLYYVNGEAAQKGATEIKLAPGDVEWWDLHNYEQECATVPAEAR
ncbi:MAG: DUF4430 domain-containing protein [Actinomycetota bacterium]|nr:DUF4430 domain-containing protein [Actinomycetota bacterium]